MKIKIKPICGQEKVIEAEETQTVFEMKEKIEKEFEGYPISQQRLRFQGKFLKNNNKPISYYRLMNGCKLELVKALRSA
ncbi:hypothetical protein JTB14_000734 [Gonioctena quinquepunctata]|nr:hypothetical protein JTB14_000734 [Gonioctena quinquepunctata]